MSSAPKPKWRRRRRSFPLQAAFAADVHRLSVLTGQTPTALSARLADATPIPVSEQALQLGIPADLVRRRPDIRNAERLLAQATANIGLAEADRYPTLTINGTIGIGSRNLEKLFQTDSLIWSIGPQLDIPVLDGGRRRAEVEVQRARTDQAAATYQNTVLTALEEVENALTAYSEEVRRRAALDRSAQTSREALALATELWVRGLTLPRRPRRPAHPLRGGNRPGGQRDDADHQLGQALSGHRRRLGRAQRHRRPLSLLRGSRRKRVRISARPRRGSVRETALTAAGFSPVLGKNQIFPVIWRFCPAKAALARRMLLPMRDRRSGPYRSPCLRQRDKLAPSGNTPMFLISHKHLVRS